MDLDVAHLQVDVPARSPRYITGFPEHAVCKHHLALLWGERRRRCWGKRQGEGGGKRGEGGKGGVRERGRKERKKGE